MQQLIRKTITFLNLYFGISNKESIFFFTLHKSASTLFSKFLFPNLKGRIHIDYANILYDKPENWKDIFRFRKKGILYGPIRVSSHPGLEKKKLVDPTINVDFISSKSCIIFTRDPRDILVSEFYSFGYTHPLNPVKEKRIWQLELRKKIQNQSIDDYAIENCDHLKKSFEILIKIQKNARNTTNLRYEDMINNFLKFSDKLNAVLEFDNDIYSEFYELTRPLENINKNSHKRSGNPGDYQKEFKEETIQYLNKNLRKVLDHFNYS
jgi:hypothetical protein